MEENKGNEMNLRKAFQQFLETGGYSTPPGRAACALASAKTLLAFREAEADERVRLRADPDALPYDAGDMRYGYVNQYGRRVSAEEASAEVDRLLERWGVWVVCSEFRSPSGEWTRADSIGGCVYSDPLDPFENGYVCDLMRVALDELESAWADAGMAV